MNFVLGNERLTVGLLDRLTANAHILEFVGDSYRFRQRLDQLQSGGNDQQPVADT